jgi:hypothetical protein
MINNLKKFTAGKLFCIILINNCNLLIPRPPYRPHKLQEKPSALKREHPALQNMKILYIFLFLWVIVCLPGSGSRSSNSKKCGSGSTTLTSRQRITYRNKPAVS